MRTRTRLALIALYFAGVCACSPRLALALDEPDEDGDVHIPEGFEERRYSIRGLTEAATSHRIGEGSFFVSGVAPLTDTQVAQIVRNCVAPDSWTKRGSARLEMSGGHMVVVQKKEVHPEIEKVLQWLRDGVVPPFRATVVAVTLKADVIKKLTAAATVSAADLMAAIEAAGDGNSETVELRGVEGQQTAAISGQQQTFIKDYDVSGAVFDPVIASTNSGMTAIAVAYRNPDCASLQIDVSVKIASKIETMQKASIQFAGIADVMAKPAEKDAKKDDKTKPPDSKKIPDTMLAEIQGELPIDLPTQGRGGLQTSLTAPQGGFVLAGTIDFSLSVEKPGTLTAVFVRATVGSGKVPVLVGVSGLKEGESYRLYPLGAGMRNVPDFPHTELLTTGDFPGPSFDGRSNPNAGGVVDAFSGPPMPQSAIAAQEIISKTQKLFVEKVRKNKLVEEMGSVLFTRLLEADHAKALANLSETIQRTTTPLDVHALAVAVPQAAFRKLMLADGVAFDEAEMLALAGNGGQVLVDTALKLHPGAQANVYAGVTRNIVYDYEISGDSYDPVIRRIPERAYAADFRCRRAPDGSSDVEVRFHAVPSRSGVERVILDTFTINSGAQVNVLMGLRAALDKVNSATLSIRANGSAPAGKFFLAGSARMPVGPDGKVDARQALVFVQAGEK